MKKLNLLSLFMLLFIANTSAQINFESIKEFKALEKHPHYLEDDDFCLIEHNKIEQRHIEPKDMSLLKNSKGNIQLDSIIGYTFNSDLDSVPSWKNEYEYDAHANCTLSVRYDWDSDNQMWVENEKKVYEYDADGNWTSLVQYEWDNVNQMWVENYKSEYEYDADGNRTLFAWYNWDPDNQMWVENYKYEYEYDAHANCTLSVRYDWDSDNQMWVENEKKVYEYDADGNRTLGLGYNWDSVNQMWVENWKSEYEYDDDGNSSLLLGYNWDNDNQMWVENYKHEYEYDVDGNMTSISYNWNSENQVWVKNYKSEVEYDADGNNILWAMYNWDSDNQVWVENYKYEYEYNTDGNWTSYVKYDWDNVMQMWVENYKFVYEYDADGNRTLIAWYNWDPDNQMWVENWKWFYYYTKPETFTISVSIEPEGAGIITGEGAYSEGTEVDITATANEGYEFVNWTGDYEHIDDVESASIIITMPAANITLTANFEDATLVMDTDQIELSVYPNPSRDKFIIESSEIIKQIQLIDINGQVLKERKIGRTQYEINVHDLHPGIYFIQIHTETGVRTERVQIVR